jgi:two-component system response regulator RegA
MSASTARVLEQDSGATREQWELHLGNGARASGASRGHVLVADPERSHLQRIAVALERDGWTVEMAPCPSELCSESVRSTEPTGFILELCPGGRDRLDYLTLIRRRYPRTKVIVMTAYPSFRSAVSAIRLGADDYAAKPISAVELTHMLQGRRGQAADLTNLPSLELMQWEYINRVLAHTDGNISAAARLLGVERSTLQRKLKKRPPGR